jgi:hypothetical protein
MGEQQTDAIKRTKEQRTRPDVAEALSLLVDPHLLSPFF